MPDHRKRPRDPVQLGRPSGVAKTAAYLGYERCQTYMQLRRDLRGDRNRRSL
jgi:hypothetical protein